MSVLVTGGAGYIGAHVVRLLRARGDDVVVVDDLSTGTAGRTGDAPLVRIDLATDDSVGKLAAAMGEHGVDSVIHIAAKKQVGESAERPAWYYAQNVGGLANLLQAMEQARVHRLMFSSSAATYGLPDVPGDALIGEDARPAPISPYGETKLVGEWMNRAAGAAWRLRTVNLRYFNVAGAGWPELGDPGVFNLIPIVLRALSHGEQPTVFGDDYPTPDGTCIRDYIHVEDLADAHLKALDYLAAGGETTAVNVGTGTGSSVLDVIGRTEKITGKRVPHRLGDRRAGDPTASYADPARAKDVLGWAATQGLEEIIATAYAWHTKTASP